MASGNARKHSSGSRHSAIPGESAEIVDIHSRGENARRANHPAADSPADSAGASHPEASEELAAALRETGDAVHIIIDQAEAVLAQDPTDLLAYRATVQGAMLRILEVCAFEDLTGQRIAKAAQVLRQVEQSSANTSHDEAVNETVSQDAPNSRLDGPALNAPHMSQTEIDAAFAG